MHATKYEDPESSTRVSAARGNGDAAKGSAAGAGNLGAVASKISHDFNNILAIFELPLEAARINPAGLDEAQIHQLLEQGAAYAADLSKRIAALARALNGERAEEED
jgi:hypothetical protein